MDTCKVAVKKRFPHLFLAVLFQISFSTQDMPDDVQDFWEQCTREDEQRHEYNRCSIAVFPSLPQPRSQGKGSHYDPSFVLARRFAAYILAKLLIHVDCLEQLSAFERGKGWDILLSPHVHHLGLTLLAG